MIYLKINDTGRDKCLVHPSRMKLFAKMDMDKIQCVQNEKNIFFGPKCLRRNAILVYSLLLLLHVIADILRDGQIEIGFFFGDNAL